MPYPTWGRGGMTTACWAKLHGAHVLWEKCGLSVHCAYLSTVSQYHGMTETNREAWLV